MCLRPVLLVLFLLIAAAPRAMADSAHQTRSGTVDFVPGADEGSLPKMFQMDRHAFDFQQKVLKTTSTNLRTSLLTFPSPVVTPHPKNNTVHCEYFCPNTPGKKPGVIVLHILGGDFDLARLFCRALTSKGVAALFLKMPYYGERQPDDSDVRMISVDPHQTVRGMRQAVLDIRQAASWLAAQEDVDPDQLGIMGVSLGGITAALTASIEPRFHRVCLLLAGGSMGEVAWTSTEMAELRKQWTDKGGTKESLFEIIKPVDPVTYARPLASRKILMLNASHDEVVPPACTEALWHAFGEPEIVWWDAGHYTAVRFIVTGMGKVMSFFQPAQAKPVASQSTAK
jgi:dienelactone hydrolase